ncbi:MAG: T9SS type A sorting domain-containing protein [Bacteroidia bacterium]
MKTKLLSLVVLLFSVGTAYSATHTISTSADWSSLTSTWSTVVDNDVIVVSSGVTLTIDQSNCNHIESEDVIIEVYGTLHFDGTGNDTRRLYLSSLSSIKLLGSGSLTTNTCSGKKRIYFGGYPPTATCSGGTGSSTSAGTAYYTFADINGAGGVGASGPVPVEWLNYDAKQVQNGLVEVIWSTASELNNSNFVVEFSENGSDWMPVAEVTSLSENGNSNSVLDYSYKHEIHTELEVVYYRIKQIDFSGDFDYTEMMVVDLNSSLPVKIETHGSGKITIKTNSQSVGTALVVTDLNGQIVEDTVFSGSINVQLDKVGIYIIQVGQGTDLEVVKHFVR